jgi:hypothetical protein
LGAWKGWAPIRSIVSMRAHVDESRRLVHVRRQGALPHLPEAVLRRAYEAQIDRLVDRGTGQVARRRGHAHPGAQAPRRLGLERPALVELVPAVGRRILVLGVRDEEEPKEDGERHLVGLGEILRPRACAIFAPRRAPARASVPRRAGSKSLRRGARRESRGPREAPCPGGPAPRGPERTPRSSLPARGRRCAARVSRGSPPAVKRPARGPIRRR